MSKLHTSGNSHRKNKASGYKRLNSSKKGRKIIQLKRKKGRKTF